jgi:predicted kinase
MATHPSYAYLLCGPSLSGKSVAAGRLERVFGATVVCADDINAERGLPFGAEGLPESTWAETLRQQLDRMQALAATGRSVIADDTLCYRWLRDKHRATAHACGLVPLLLVLRPSEAELLDRHSRVSTSRERPVLGLERLQSHLAGFEWPTDDEKPIEVTLPEQLDVFIEAHLPRTRNAAYLHVGERMRR